MIKEVIPIKTKALPIFKIRCTYCKFKFRAEDLEEHQTEFHPQGFLTSFSTMEWERRAQIASVATISDQVENKFNTDSKTSFKNPSKEKNCKCTFCGKSFSQAGTLKQHIQSVHKGHKQYKCDTCGKSFFKPDDLKMHIRDIHTILEGHKDYWCDPCAKSFSQSEELKKHIRSSHSS